MVVRAEDWHDYEVGDHVQTIDGYLGVIAEVVDGPYPGTERYAIVLDDGMGGGDYDVSDIMGKLNGGPSRTIFLPSPLFHLTSHPFSSSPPPRR